MSSVIKATGLDWNTWGDAGVEQEQKGRAFQNNASRAWEQEEEPGLRERDLELENTRTSSALPGCVLQRPVL